MLVRPVGNTPPDPFGPRIGRRTENKSWLLFVLRARRIRPSCRRMHWERIIPWGLADFHSGNVLGLRPLAVLRPFTLPHLLVLSLRCGIGQLLLFLCHLRIHFCAGPRPLPICTCMLPPLYRTTGIASLRSDETLYDPHMSLTPHPAPANSPVGMTSTYPEAGISRLMQGPLYDRARIPRRGPLDCGRETPQTLLGDKDSQSCDHSSKGNAPAIKTPRPRGGHREDSPQQRGRRRDSLSHSPASRSWSGSWPQLWNALNGYGKDCYGNHREK